jgi:uncharacterized membrane protein
VIQKHRILLSLFVLSVSLLSFGQTQPCPSGSLANVLGTSCTIGNLTFNFQNNFNGSSSTDDFFGNFQITLLAPDTIGFAPFTSATQAGFLLAPNFVDNTNGTGLSFSFHGASFSYSVQANGAFEILGESSTINGSVSQTGFDDLFAFDRQCFTNGQCIEVAPTVNFSPSNFFNNPSATATFPIPIMASTGVSLNGFTTAIDSSASDGGEATLTSASFLYTVAPQIPPPPPANLEYRNIDLSGFQLTSSLTINDHGQIGGVVQDFSGAVHGFITDRDEENLRLIDFPGATFTFLESINDTGDAVGGYTDNIGASHGFLLTDGSFSTIDFPGALFNAAEGINNHGQVAGFYLDDTAAFNVHGYLFQNGNFTSIDDPNAFIVINPGFPPFAITEIFSINNLGDMAGLYVDLNNVGHSFLLSNGVFQPFAVPAGVQGTFATGLNDPDDIVGTFVDVAGVTHGFLLQNGMFSTVDFPNATSTLPNDIDSAGRIVGDYTDTTGAFHSFMAERASGNSTPAQVEQPSVSNGATVVVPNAPSSPCMMKQPMRPDPKTGTLTCTP